MHAPDSYGGPAAQPKPGTEPTWLAGAGEMVRDAYTLRSEDDDFGQPGTLVREVMDDQDRKNLASSIVGHASDRDVQADMQPRVVQCWTNVDKDLGAAVKEGLGV